MMKMIDPFRVVTSLVAATAIVLGGADVLGAEVAGQVSFTKQVVPILRVNCNACHKPDKTKGDLDLTTQAAILKGGKHGAVIVPGKPEESRLMKMIVGDPPEMPDDGDPLKVGEVELVKQWIAQGAKDDTPADDNTPVAAPVYQIAPVITSMKFSPDGQWLAVAGYHEVLLHKADGSGLVHRLVGRAERVEGIAFSPDGKLLGVCGGSPAEFGQVQFWDPAEGKLIKSYRLGYDSLYGISFSPDGKKVAFGAADKAVRTMEIETGKIGLDFRAHADWTFGTAFTLDGKQLVSAGRDMALKLIDLENQRFVDDINNPKDKIVSFARHPKEEQVVYGGDLGGVRLYKISDNQQRTAGRNDTNMIREFERQSGPAHAVAFSPDGMMLAVGVTGEVKVYNVGDGALKATLPGFDGPVYAITWKPDGTVIAAAGFDGRVRLYNAADGKAVKEFVPVPIGYAVATQK